MQIYLLYCCFFIAASCFAAKTQRKKIKNHFDLWNGTSLLALILLRWALLFSGRLGSQITQLYPFSVLLCRRFIHRLKSLSIVLLQNFSLGSTMTNFLTRVVPCLILLVVFTITEGRTCKLSLALSIQST